VFERFTEPARQAVLHAQEEARSLRRNYIGSEHILLGLLREEQGLAARVLQHLGVTLEGVREQVVRIVGSGEEVTGGQQIPFTPRAKKIMELALREARSMSHDYIGTEHLLLAIVREHDGVAMRILLDLDADAEKIRNLVIGMLSGPSGRRGPRAIPAVAPFRVGPRPPLDWQRASMLWRPDGLELRVPLRLSEGAIAMFATDEAWTQEPLAGMRRRSGTAGWRSPRPAFSTRSIQLTCGACSTRR
jgi:hypothetical protein